MPVSSIIPQTGGGADDLVQIRSKTVKFMEHVQANFYFCSGQPFTVFPTMGAWSTYGLGSQSKNQPCFVILGSG